jgi:solute:Na+ symporter, SSS family
VYASEMAQNFWTAIDAWTACFVVTILVSLLTLARDEKDLVGLVYSVTPRIESSEYAWYLQPKIIGVLVLAVVTALNVAFW